MTPGSVRLAGIRWLVTAILAAAFLSTTTTVRHAQLYAAQAQREYRLSHLETHRRMRALLTDKQVAAYHRLGMAGAMTPNVRIGSR